MDSLPQRSLTSQESVFAKARYEMFDREADRGNDNTLWSTMQASFRSIGYRYSISGSPIQLFEVEMHDIWYMFIQSAKNIDADHPAQDRLTRLVVWARELGVMTRTLTSSSTQIWQLEEEGRKKERTKSADGDKDDVNDEKGNGLIIQDAMTTDGYIWADLPFLVYDLRSAWNQIIDPSTSTAHRLNFTAAIARLAGLGIRDDALSGCGLGIMRETLETSNIQVAAVLPPGATGGGNSKQVPLTMMQLLPVVQIWLRYAGDKLLRLSQDSQNVSTWSVDDSFPGELARNAGVDSIGFSKARFLFWKHRLEVLAEHNQETIQTSARNSFNLINGIWQSLGSQN